jgi:hypothetical protein
MGAPPGSSFVETGGHWYSLPTPAGAVQVMRNLGAQHVVPSVLGSPMPALQPYVPPGAATNAGAGGMDAQAAVALLASGGGMVTVEGTGRDGRVHYVSSYQVMGRGAGTDVVPNWSLPDDTGVVVHGRDDSVVITHPTVPMGTQWYTGDKVAGFERSYGSPADAVNHLVRDFGVVSFQREYAG